MQFNLKKYFDLVVTIGDLSHDCSPETYHCFAKRIMQLQVLSVWLPGNHDYQLVMINVLAEYGISCAKQVLMGDELQLLLLDSQVYGMQYDKLSDYQLEWLVQVLIDQLRRHTNVIVTFITPSLLGISGLINTVYVTLIY